MRRLLVVLANASLCRLLLRDGDAEAFVPLPVLQHPESRLPARELAADRPGHEAVDRSSGGNRFEPRVDPRRHEHAIFAHEIARSLQARHAAGDYDDVWLLASDPFLGELKAALGDPVARCVRQTWAIDLTALGLAEIEARLQALRSTRETSAHPR